MTRISKPFFSLIIPCFNSKKTIRRLLDSLLVQGIKYTDLQIILVNDGNADNWTDILADYDNKLMYEVVNTDTNIHCPSNSRLKGMDYVKGEWVCFADHDDFFEIKALKKVKKYINKNTVNHVLVTILRSWDEKENVFSALYHKNAWLHGKFYNADFLKSNNINFKKDLITHEDIYFNSCVMAWFIEHGQAWTYYDIVTYRWVENPESITRSYNKDRGYLHDNFNDYIEASSGPFWDGAKNGNAMLKDLIYMSLLHCYFYYEAGSYYMGANAVKDHQYIIKELIDNIKQSFSVTEDDIINYIYADSARYRRVRDDCVMCESDFVEKTSFRDFIYRITGNSDRTALGH